MRQMEAFCKSGRPAAEIMRVYASEDATCESGYPSAETARRLHEELLFQAAAQVLRWSLPITDVVAVSDGQRAV